MHRPTRTTGNWRGNQTAQPVPVEVGQSQQETYSKPEPQTIDYYATNETIAQTQVQNMDTSTTNGDAPTEKKFPAWKKVNYTADGRVIKRKKDPNAVHMRLRKYVQPKNAAMCLNELKKVTYVTENDGPGQPTCVVVEVDGQQFRGYGSSKQLAKQAAAEAALVSFVKPPSTGGSNIETPDEESVAGDVGEEGAAKPKDSTPWAVLASFAMYKLFSDWREGRVGVCGGPSPLYGGGLNGPNMAQALQQLLTASGAGGQQGQTSDGSASAISAYLKLPETVKLPLAKRLRYPGQDDLADIKPPQPAKVLPANASTMHPVMLLHQMRPLIVYSQMQPPLQAEVPKVYTVTAVIDENDYKGQGPNAKKAKVELALKANSELFGVISTWTPSEKMPQV